MSQLSVERLLKALEAASSDNDHFASLLALGRAVPHLSDEEQGRALRALDAGFLARLLRTREAPVDCSVYMYKSLAVSVLSHLLGLPTCRDDLLPVLTNLIQSLTAVSDVSTDSEQGEFIKLGFVCLHRVIQPPFTQLSLRLLTPEVIELLCDCIVHKRLAWKDSLTLLLAYNSKFGNTWSLNFSSLGSVVNVLVTDLENSDTKAQHLFTLETISALMFGINNNNKSFSEYQFIFKFRKLALGLLSNNNLRPHVLSISANIIQGLSSDLLKLTYWDNDKLGSHAEDETFFSLLSCLSCGEIQLRLEAGSFASLNIDNGNITSLISGFVIVEECVHLLVTGFFDNPAHIKTLYENLRETFRIICVCLLSEGDKLDPHDLLLMACLRSLCLWLNEDSQLQESIDLSPLIQLFARVAIADFKSDTSLDLTRLMLPFLCSFTSTVEGRSALTSSGFTHFLCKDYVQQKLLNVLVQTTVSSTCNSSPDLYCESAANLVLLCNVMLNFTLLDDNVSETSSARGDLLLMLTSLCQDFGRIISGLITLRRCASVFALSCIKAFHVAPSHYPGLAKLVNFAFDTLCASFNFINGKLELNSSLQHEETAESFILLTSLVPDLCRSNFWVKNVCLKSGIHSVCVKFLEYSSQCDSNDEIFCAFKDFCQKITL